MAVLAESILRGDHLRGLRVLILHCLFARLWSLAACALGPIAMRWVGVLLRRLRELRVLSLGSALFFGE